MWHFKTVPYDSLRMCDLNNNYNSLNYKNATASYTKMVLQNRLRMSIVETCFFSNENMKCESTLKRWCGSMS